MIYWHYSYLVAHAHKLDNIKKINLTIKTKAAAPIYNNAPAFVVGFSSFCFVKTQPLF